MKKISIIGLLTILVLVIGISGCVGNTQTNNTSNQTVQQNTTQNSTNGTVSAQEAKKTAQKYIKEPGATAGEPTLINTDGNQKYIVPVMLKGNQIGEVIIDAQTGENQGGAGGVPNETK